MTENQKTIIPGRLERFVKPYLHFKFLRLDLGHQLGCSIGPYVFRIYLPFQMRRKAIKKLLLSIWKYWSSCHKAGDRSSFRIFLKDISATFHDYRTTGVMGHPIIDRRKIQKRYQCLRADTCCLSNKNHKDGCGLCTVRIAPMRW
jgi:hypothetical protein